MPALPTAPNVATEGRRAAGLDRRHYAVLATIEVAGIGLAIGLAVAAEDIRHLQGGASHVSSLSSAARTPLETPSPVP